MVKTKRVLSDRVLFKDAACEELAAQAFCLNLAAASFDCAYGYPKSAGGIAVVAASPLVMLGAQAFTARHGSASFDAAATALRYAQAAAGDDGTVS
jgi:hypothetical protein